MKDTSANENTRRQAEKPAEEKLRGKRLGALVLAILLGVGIVGGLFLLMFAPTAGAIVILGYTPVGALLLWLLLRDRNRRR